jgi:RNA 2',3'-cyclic 3'-phosphodiesterase
VRIAPVAPDAGKPLRLFIALWPGEALRRAITSWQQAWSWPPRAALVKPDRLHLTLHFLGDVPSNRLPRLVDGLKARVEPFTLALREGEVWPNGVALLRPDTIPPALVRLHAALRRELEEQELPVESRSYRAHVTLARRAHGAIPPQQGPNLRWPIDSGYVLVRSLPGGAGYDVLARFN